MTVANANPPNTRDTAAVCRSAGTAAIATWEATAMNSAWARAEPSRAVSSTLYEPASADSTAEPAANAMVAASNPRRGSRRVRTVAAGPPTVTTSMYTVTNWPAAGTDTVNSVAICGSRPTRTNSAVATANEQSIST
jgi:hypothetical protein